MSEGVVEQRDVVNKRIDYIELLSETGPLEPRDFVDELDDSRSTVTRALEELREAKLVTREPEGYVATVAATMAAEEYRRHEATSRDILGASELLEPLPEGAAPPSELLADARTHLTEPSAPFRPLETVADRLRAADSVRAYLPTLVNPSLLRLWHRQVTAGEVDSVGLFDANLLTQLQGQYPSLFGEMNAAACFSSHTVDGPPYGLLLTTESDDERVTLVVYDGEGGVRGVVVNDSPDSVEWARTRLGTLEATATTVDDEFSPTTGFRESAWGVPQTARDSGPDSEARREETPKQELPLDLKTEGFVRLSDDYFDAHDEAPPEVSWKTGFTLAEVRAGHVVDRVDDEGRRIVERIVDGLHDGDDHVLLGPPGGGKSTTCMAVACEWFDRKQGPVLYRERGRGDELESTSLLEAYLRQVDGHALVVVEDAVRREANAVFELVQLFGGRDDITFLLDSRESEWNEPEDLTLDPRVDAVRRTGLEEVSIPELDEDGYERFATHFDRLVGESDSGTHSADDLRASIADSAGSAAEPGTPLLAQTQLSRAHTLPSSREFAGPNALEADIVDTFQSLNGDPPELTIDLAVLVNLLNAAGVPVAAEYLYALTSNEQYGAVETAIARLEGEVLFARREKRSTGAEYRTRHEEWSRRFLEQLLELLPEAEARASFGRCVSRLLSLADDEGQRAGIRRHLGAATPRLRQIDADPMGWADEVTERVFTLGQSYSQLAPLYGLTDDGTIELPEACSPFVEHKQAWWRADMNGYQGATERAKVEVDRLANVEASDPGLSPEEAERLQFLGQRGLAMYARVGGNNNTAHQHATRALELAQSIEDSYKIAQARELLVGLELRRERLEAAREHVEGLQTLANEHDSKAVEEVAVRNESRILLVQGAYDEARRLLCRTLDRDRSAAHDGAASYKFVRLAIVALAQNDFELAESSLSSALEIARDSGQSMALCVLYSWFAHLARKRGEVGDAERYLQRAAERPVDLPRLVAVRSRSLALVEQMRGSLDAAADAAREAVDAATEIGDPVLKTDALQTLAQILVESSNFSEAEPHIRQSRETIEPLENTVKVATCDRLRARLELACGNLEAAERFASEGLRELTDAGIEDEVADCYRVLGLVALEQGDLSEAREHLGDGLEAAEGSGVVHRVAQLHETIGRLEVEAGERKQARHHQEVAVDGFERLGDTERVRELRSALSR